MVDIQRQSQNGKTKSPPPVDPTTVDHERGALVVKELSAAATLATLVGKNFKGAVSLQAFKIYHDQLLRDSGQPTDAIESMLIEQCMLAHHMIGNLHVQASAASSPETFEIYCTAATKLMAEFRRTSLALHEYRAPHVPTQVTVVRQQNLAAGNQQIALVDKSCSDPTQNLAAIPDSINPKKALTHAISPTFDSPIPERNRTPIKSV